MPSRSLSLRVGGGTVEALQLAVVNGHRGRHGGKRAKERRARQGMHGDHVTKKKRKSEIEGK